MSNDKLSGKDKIEITIQSALQLIPYIGASLSTAYFGTKQEKRFKRIESFYQEFSDFIQQNNLQISSFQQHNEEMLIALIEELNEKIERESVQIKRNYFKKYLYSTLSMSVNESSFDEQRYFLDTLANMTLLECEILLFLKQHGVPVQVSNISKPYVDQYAIVASIGRLKINGFLQAATTTIAFGENADNSLFEEVSISSFGNKFITYCLK